MTNDFITRLTSRKFLLAVFGLVVILLQGTVNFTPEQVESVVQIIIAFTAAEGVADAITRYTNIPEIEDAPKVTARKK